MGRRRPNYRLVKRHRSYSVEEIARLLRVHKNTVRAWLRQDLPTIDGRRPTLVHGPDPIHFLKNRRQVGKRPCGPDELFCVKCRWPRVPAGRIVDFIPLSATSGNLQGICPDCDSLIHRRVSRTSLDEVAAGLAIQFREDHPRIGKSSMPSVGCDFDQEAGPHADSQS